MTGYLTHDANLARLEELRRRAHGRREGFQPLRRLPARLALRPE